MTSWFEELSSSHQEWVELTRKINFETGIRHSMVEKYPDPVHFVYELLQNAEDQGASEAQFQLFATHLVFSHNGNPFNRQDVENISGIGNSNKPQEEANKIGRFGIGFKSVFAITERPEIYTEVEGQPFAFAIENLVVPIAISVDTDRHNQFKTNFLFPFIQGQKYSLYTKIKDRLSSLSLETLLFLHNLVSIEWRVGPDHGVYLREVKGSRCELCGESKEDGQIRQSNANYLVFTREVNLSESERALDVCIAFRLDEKGKLCSEERSPNLAVYFPTEQPTGLNFRVHGPFLLTDNRANIKNEDDTNNRLIQECALLLGESIRRIKELDLLTVDFISLLPIRKENTSTQFLPLYEQVLKLFQQYPLLPTANETFASASQVKLARGADLRDLINEQQLSKLYGTLSPLHWLSAEIPVNRTSDLYRYLTKDLQIEEVDPEIFARKLEMPFLEQQTDEWLIRLYIFLSKQPSLSHIIKSKSILRLEDNSHVTPFKKTPYTRNETPNAYLLRKGESKFPLVKKVLLADDTVYSFLKGIGLSEPDIVDEVLRFILPLYEKGEVALDDEGRNWQDLHHIQGALLKCTDYHVRQELIDKLKKTPFLQAINAKTFELAWKAPCVVYRETQELRIWFEGNDQAWFIADTLPESLCTDLNIRNHLQPKAATGYAGYVTILDGRGDHQRGLHHFDPRASLEGLDQALDFITLDKARILWRILLEYRHLIKGIVEASRYQDFKSSWREEKFSKMGQLCSQKAWFPHKEGYFCVPQELFLTDLPEDFEKDTDEAQELVLKLGMRRAEELQLADKLGIPHENISLILHNLEAFRAWCEQQQRTALPSSIANDPVRRQEKAAEAAHTTEVKTYKPVTINRRTSAGYGELKTYLRIHNTNEDGQLICQLCDQPMPFKLPDGEEYFEAYQYIDLLEKEYVANHLALCPNCAAEFQNACQTDENEKADLILDLDPTADEENLVVYIDMPVHEHLRFTQKHLIDLQGAIKNWRETDSNIESGSHVSNTG